MAKAALSLLMTLLMLAGLLGVFPTAAFAASGDYFVLVAQTDDTLVIEPARVGYGTGQTIKDALAAQFPDTFTGLDDGFVTAIDGVEYGYSVYDSNGGYDLTAQASSITLLRFGDGAFTGPPSGAVSALITSMAGYNASAKALQDVDAQAAYSTAKAAYLTADDTAAQSLADTLNSAVEAAEAGGGDPGEPGTATVYFSISKDGSYLTGNDADATAMARVPVTVEYFDLADYGLADYYRYEADAEGNYTGSEVLNQPTVLHLFIKVLEDYYLANGSKLELAGADKAFELLSGSGARSLGIRNFWGETTSGTNTVDHTYFVNHAFPLMNATTGASADYILLEDGMTVDYGMFSDSSFPAFGAAAAYFAPEALAVETGEEFDITLKYFDLFQTFGPPYAPGPANMSPDPLPMADETLYYTDDLAKPREAWSTVPGVTGADGKISFAINEPGTFYVTAGPDYATSVNKYYSYYSKCCIAPPVAVVTVDGEPVEPATALLGSLSFRNSAYSTSTLHTLEPAFDAAIKEYTVTLAESSASLGVWATLADDAEGTITASYTNASTGEAATADIPSRSTGNGVSLANMLGGSGGPPVTLTLIATVGGVADSYTVTFKRAARTLSALSISDGDSALTLAPAFKAATRAYTANLLETAQTLAVAATPAYSGYTLTVNGSPAQNGAAEVALDPARDTEVLTIEVSHPEDEVVSPNPNTYTVTLHKKPLADVKFKVQPADATVFLLDADNQRIWPDGDTYRLMGGQSYSYNVTKAGYVGTTATIEAKSETINVSLDTVPPNDAINPDISSTWPSFRGNDANSAAIDAKMPTAKEDAILYWANSLTASGYMSGAIGVPIIVDNTIIATAKNNIFKLDRITGEVLAVGEMVSSSSFNTIPPTYAEGKIFVHLQGATVQAFNADDLTSLWVFKDATLPASTQDQSQITYRNGYLYVGWMSTKNNMVCLTADDEDPTQTHEAKLPTWVHDQHGDTFYWAGSLATDNFVLVCTDKGAMLSLHPTTGRLIDSITGLGTQIRSSVSYDADTNRYYFTSKNGECLYQVAVGDDGIIDKSSLRSLPLGGMSTSTPAIYNGRAYVGVCGTSQFGNYSGHSIAVIDLASFTIAYKVETKGYLQSSGLICTGYEDEDGYVYVYFCENTPPGSLRFLKDKPGVTQPLLTTVEENAGKTYTVAPTLFDPQGASSQFSLSSAVADEYGTIYYKNDSAYLMAVGSKIERLTITAPPTKVDYAVGDSFDISGLKATVTYANGMTRDVSGYLEGPEDPLSTDDFDAGVTVVFPHVAYGANGEVTPPSAVVDISLAPDGETAGKINRVKQLIAAIGEVTAESGPAITAARAAYDALADSNPELLEKITNYEALLAAEAAFTMFGAKAAAKAELDAYASPDNYRPAQQAELAAAIEAGKLAIDAAPDPDGIAAALAAAKKVIDAIKTDAQLLKEECDAIQRLSITPSQAELEKGEALTFEYALNDGLALPGKSTLHWQVTSDVEGILSFAANDGRAFAVQAGKAGSAKVTLTVTLPAAGGGRQLTASAAVEVRASKASVTLDKGAVTLLTTPGKDTAVVNVSVLPAGRNYSCDVVTLKSAASPAAEVARVENLTDNAITLKALSAGSAVLVVRDDDGTAEARCAISVEAAPNPDPEANTARYHLDPAKVTMPAYSTTGVELGLWRDAGTPLVLSDSTVSFIPAGKTKAEDFNILKALLAVGVRDDRTVTLTLPDTVSVADRDKLKASYTLKMVITQDGTSIEVPETLTLKLDKKLPAVKAPVVQINTFYTSPAQRTVSMDGLVTGGTVEHISRNDADKNKTKKNDDIYKWLTPVKAGENITGFTYTLEPAANRSGTLYLKAKLDGWKKEVPFTLKVTAKLRKPALKLSSSNASIYLDYNHYLGTPLSLKPKTVGATLDELGVTGIRVADVSTGSYKASQWYEVKQNTLDGNGSFTLQPRGFGTAQVKKAADLKAGKVLLQVSIANGSIVDIPVTVKLVNANAKITLKPEKSTITLNPKLNGGDSCALSLAPNIPGLDMDGFTFGTPAVFASNGKSAPDAANNPPTAQVIGKNALHITVPQGSKAGQTYKVKLGLVRNIDSAEVSTLTVTVKTAGANKNATVSFKAKGSIDLTKNTTATVTARFANYLGSYWQNPTFKVYTGTPGKQNYTEYPNTLYFDRVGDSNSWTAGLVNGAEMAPGTYKVLVSGGTLSNNTPMEGDNSFSIKVTATKPRITQSTRAITLYRNQPTTDMAVALELPDGTAPVSRVVLKGATVKEKATGNMIDNDKMYYDLDYEGGICYIGFKNDEADARARRATTLTLEVYLKGNAKVAATVKVKVTPKL